MKKYIVLGIIAISVLCLSIFYLYKPHKITYFAKLEKVSTSGEARFRWYDINTQKVRDPDNQYAWFWATPENVPSNSIATTNWVSYLEDNSESVFKITGVKQAPDCDYWDKDHCVENINVKSIKVSKQM